MDLFAFMLSTVLLAPPSPPVAITHQYPIHYDGPFISHARPGARPRSSGGSLPSFDVTYHGGPVLQSTSGYTLFWFPYGSGSNPLIAYETLINGFFQAIGGTSYYGVAASYSTQSAPIQNSSTLIESDVDGDPFPKTLDVTAIETELAKLVANHEFPATLDDPILVFLPQGAPFTVQSPDVCALHGAFNFRHKKATPVVFAVIPYQGGNAACEAYRAPYKVPNPSVPGGDAAITNASRELLEMVTDPLGNAWYDDAYGEIGDICFFDYGDQGLLGSQANYQLGSVLYQIPEAFEQSAAACRPNLGGGSSQADLMRPGLTRPDLTRPGLTRSELTRPGLTRSGLTRPDVRTPSSEPTPGVTYHGGPIQPAVTAYTIFWGSAGISQTFQTNVEQFESDLGGGDYYSVLTQYTGTNGAIQNAVTYGGAYLDTSSPPSSVTMKQAGKEVLKALAANPSWSAGLGAQFFVYTPKGVVPSPSFCGSHSSTTLKSGKKSVDVVYAYIPSATGECTTPFDLPSPTGDVASDEAIKTMGHEGAEMMSDPLGNGWKGSVKDTEVADLCIGNFGMVGLIANGANIVLNGHAYRVQELWSQQTEACAPNL